MKQMLTKIFLICLISSSNCWSVGNSFDPDADICDDPNFSGGVVADDGETYLFKGDYYWKTRPLTKDSGIIGYGQLVTNEWPEVNDKIRLVFTVTKDQDLITVFVVKNNWIGYQLGSKIANGTVDGWPEFKKLKVSSVFTQTFGGTLVYVLYANNYYYILYDFANLSKPEIVRTGKATIRANYLVFTEETSSTMPGLSIRNLIDVRAGLTYIEKIFLLSSTTYCTIDLMANSFERKCKPKDIKPLLGCPLDLSKRPITTTTITTHMPKPVTYQLRTELTAIKTTTENITGTSSDSESVVETTPSKSQPNQLSTGLDFGEQIRTGITILGRPLADEEDTDEKTDGPQAGGIEVAIPGSKSQSSESWVLVVIVGVIIMSLLAILIVGGVARVKNKSQHKGVDYYT